jgi:dienelactone hydrolase
MNKRVLIASFVFVLIFFAVHSNACNAQNSTIGVVALHGKGDRAGSSGITQLVLALMQKGFVVIAPEMPYSKYRKYDKSYEETVLEIDNAVKELKKRGALKIFIAGHSMGANVALHYATQTKVDGVIAVAPGHTPDLERFQETTGDSVLRARKMVEEGKGYNREIFTDINQGNISSVEVPAYIYLSWFDPDGHAVIPRNASTMKPDTALLWVVGKLDPLYKRGTQYAFDLAPPNPRNKYLVINSNHWNTPTDAAGEIIKWLLEF